MPAAQAAPGDAADIAALAAAGRLVAIDGVPHVLRLPFRMLDNRELAAAMGFPPDYPFAGTGEQITRQIGNAVPVGTAAALVTALLADAAAVPEAAP